MTGGAALAQTVLVTGASGFVGRVLCAHLAARGFRVRQAVRRAEALSPDRVSVGDLSPRTDWSLVLAGAETVVHLAARVHVMRESDADPAAEFRRVNVDATTHLARSAAAAGVRRLVFLSSVKVHGEVSERPFTEADPPRPEDPYGRSKWEAEQELAQVGRATGMQWTVVRPPLVYGPGAKANFLSLMRAVARGMPLPLGAIHNRRSLLYLGNLVDAIRMCLVHQAAANRVFLVSDGEDLSTPELVRRLALALGVKAHLLQVPTKLLRLGGGIIGRGPAIDRLVGSLQVDSSAIRRALDWVPPYTIDQGIAETARWYRCQN